jgi:hypothetical protein
VLYCRAGLLDVCCGTWETLIVVATSGNPSRVAPRRKMNGKNVEGCVHGVKFRHFPHSIGELFNITTRRSSPNI